MPFVHLHVHSEYSLLDSVCRLPELVSEAKAMGCHALAITDQHVLYGAIPFYRLCMKAGIKPVIGMEVVLSDSESMDKMVLLAKNETGYRQLIALSTRIQQEGTSSMTMRDICGYQDGLILLISATEGRLARLILNGEKGQAVDYLKSVKHYFNQDVYLEIQDHFTRSEKECLRRIRVISEETDILCAASNNVYYINQKQATGRQILNGIRDGVKIETSRIGAVNSEFYLKTPEQMKELFASNSEAVERTGSIADQCNLTLSFDTYRLPRFAVPNQENAGRYLASLTYAGMEKRYSQPDEKVRGRVQHELSIISQMGFNDYFLIVWDLIRHAKENGIRPGPGRGSAAGSIVSYCLGITDVDPIRHNLLFERFLNPERVSMPDIDIDFPDKDREYMIQYVCEKYGKTHAAQIITFGTLAAKAAIRDVGRVLDLPARTVDKVAKGLSGKPGTRLPELIKSSAQLQRMISDPAVEQLTELAMMVEGLPRHSSIHAAGIVISESPLTDWVPLQEGRDGISLTQYPMEDLEALGLLKMDFLGLRNLTLLESMVRLINETENIELVLEELPENDEAAFRVLRDGDTTGIFQLESPGMREVLKQLKPTSFEDIVAVNALYRPGPMQFIKDFIKGKHQPDKVDYPHPDLKKVLAATYGIIVYQEQIMEIASIMAGFSLGEADILRRAVSKKKRDVLEQQRAGFIKGCLQKGYDESTADHIYKLIVRFADYGFNRSHAVAYSLISYRFAYLKAHFPQVFTASLLSSVIHHSDKIAEIISESKRKGFKVLPPTVNESGTSFVIGKNSILFGLGAVKNVSTQAAKTIIEERNKGPFKDLRDFCQRVPLKKVNRKAVESLIFAGAMDGFNDNRAVLIGSLDRLYEDLETMSRSSNFEQTRLLDEDSSDIYVDTPPFTLKEQMHFEKEALGMYLSTHPLDTHQKKLSGYDAKTIARVGSEGLRKARVALLIEECRQIKTKKGQWMAFLNVSDSTGQKEVIVFPAVYEKQRALFQENSLIFAEITEPPGKKEDKWVIQKAIAINDLQDKQQPPQTPDRAPAVYMQIDEAHEDNILLNQLREILGEFKGNTPVFLHYRREKKTIKLSSDYHVAPSDSFLIAIERLIGQGNVMIRNR